jgi:murein DD-endopeptidase MepM/ murein hydrolase activator NlpD
MPRLRNLPRRLLLGSLFLALPAGMWAQTSRGARAPVIPPLPDSSGWGVHVLAIDRDPVGGLWAGTYGEGIFRLRPGSTEWEQIRHDTTATSISWDFVHAFAFGRRGEIWYGTVGNGWGVSRDSGATWTNWTFAQLGPEWQYVAPDGIVVRGDTAWVGTADGIQMTTDDGAHWIAFADTVGPRARGPADTVIGILGNEYVRRLGLDRSGLLVTTLKGNVRIMATAGGFVADPVNFPAFSPRNRILVNGVPWRGTTCGIRRLSDTLPCFRRATRSGEDPRPPKTIWFRRPIDRLDNPMIDQTYRYGSTMGGNFQQHQGVEFNNPDGTPVYAIGAGRVVYAGPAEQGALTVAIRHDTTVSGAGGQRLRIFSVYYHNSALKVKVGQRVAAGQVISLVGNTGRATNDHLHLEVHAAPTEDVHEIVDSLQRFPPYTTNPELWIEPLPNTGILAGQVFDTAGQPVPQARIYGIIKTEPVETPLSYAETYGDKAHSHPLYGEHFAISDVPPGEFIIGTEIDGKKVFRKVTVEAGKLTWVVFRR